MYYQVSKEFFDKLPNACFGAVAVRGLDNTHDIPELEQMLADTKNTSFHRSAQYESSYLYRRGGGTTLCVWYESESDLALKTALCRMLGVKTVYILRESPAIGG